MNHIHTDLVPAWRIVLTTFASLLATTAAAQAFPSKTIRIVAPFPPASVADVVARLNAETVRILALPDIKANFANLGMTAASSTPEQFSAYVQEEIVRWAKVVKASGARAD